MSKTSWFKFSGEISPKSEIPHIRAGYSLNRTKGSVGIDFEGPNISIEFVTNYDSFEDVYAETLEYVQAFLSVQSLKTGFPISFFVHEWVETPLEPLGSDGVSHPVRGRVYSENRSIPIIPKETFEFALAKGLRWVEDMEWNPFLKRAVLDFNYALQHPINDVPIYLFRAVESAQTFFGGEGKLIAALNVKTQVKLVKRIADDAQSGLHVRHAAKTSEIRKLSEDEVIKAVNATREILEKFQMETWIRRSRENATV